MKSKIKKGIILPALDDAYFKKAFEFIERTAPHLTTGMIRYKNDVRVVKDHLKWCDVPSLAWFDDCDFLYWGHENFTQLNWYTFLGEL